MAQRGKTPPLIALSGVGPKIDFAEKIYESLTWGVDLKILPPMDVLLSSVGSYFGAKISGEQFWAVENLCIEFEQKHKDSPKLVCSTPLDRLVVADFSGLKMSSYFDRVLPSFVADCDLFCYRPDALGLVCHYKGEQDDYVRMDEIEKCAMMAHDITPQVLIGTDEQQLQILHESLKLKFVGVVKDA